jgi:hypothetical protein
MRAMDVPRIALHCDNTFMWQHLRRSRYFCSLVPKATLPGEFLLLRGVAVYCVKGYSSLIAILSFILMDASE